MTAKVRLAPLGLSGLIWVDLGSICVDLGNVGFLELWADLGSSRLFWVALSYCGFMAWASGAFWVAKLFWARPLVLARL